MQLNEKYQLNNYLIKNILYINIYLNIYLK